MYMCAYERCMRMWPVCIHSVYMYACAWREEKARKRGKRRRRRGRRKVERVNTSVHFASSRLCFSPAVLRSALLLSSFLDRYIYICTHKILCICARAKTAKTIDRLFEKRFVSIILNSYFEFFLFRKISYSKILFFFNVLNFILFDSLFVLNLLSNGMLDNIARIIFDVHLKN